MDGNFGILLDVSVLMSIANLKWVLDIGNMKMDYVLEKLDSELIGIWIIAVETF